MRAVPTFAAVALAADAALACVCADPAKLTLAPNGSTDVPTNTRVWVGEELGGAHATLREANGVDLAVERSALSLTVPTGQPPRIHVLRPRAALRANTEHEIVVGETVLTRFTTGAGVDETAPGIPRIRSLDTHTAEENEVTSCGRPHGATFTLEDDPGRLLVVMERPGHAALDPAQLAGTLTGTDAGRGDSERGVLRLADSACTRNWPEVEPGASAAVRFGAFDVAGNFSGWTDLTTVTLPPLPAAEGCSIAGNAGLIALAAAVLARRRR